MVNRSVNRLLNKKEMYLDNPDSSALTEFWECLIKSPVYTIVYFDPDSGKQTEFIRGLDGKKYLAVFTDKSEIPSSVAETCTVSREPMSACMLKVGDSSGIVVDAYTEAVTLDLACCRMFMEKLANTSGNEKRRKKRKYRKIVSWIITLVIIVATLIAVKTHSTEIARFLGEKAGDFLSKTDSPVLSINGVEVPLPTGIPTDTDDILYMAGLPSLDSMVDNLN